MSDNEVYISTSSSKLGQSGITSSFPALTYSHEKKALGGYWAASFTVYGIKPGEIKLWAETGIGSHVQAEVAGGIIWEGVVDELVITLPNSTITIGSLSAMSNRVSVRFQDIEAPFNLPIGGTFDATGWVEDSASVAQFGELEAYLSAGAVDPAVAATASRTYLGYNAWPIYERQVTQQPGTGFSLVANCIGYSRIMDRRYYDNPGITGTVNISNKIKDILSNADFLDSDYSVEENTLQAYDEQLDQPTLLKAIQDLVSLGDSSFNRYTFGVYANQKAIYRAVPTSPTYLVGEDGKMSYPNTNTNIPLGLVEPGSRVEFSDIFSAPLDYHYSAPSKVDIYPIIETASFTYPNTLSITTGRTTRLDAIFAAYGLSGM